MHKNFSLALSLLAALAFVACGDDSSSATSDDSNSVNLDSSTDVIPGSDRGSKNANITVDSFDDIIKCNAKREGKTVFVKDEESLYTCEDGEWVETSFDDSNEPASGSSSSVTPGSSSSVILSSESEGSSSSINAQSSSSGAESSNSKPALSSSRTLSSSSTPTALSSSAPTEDPASSSARSSSSSSVILSSESEESSSSINAQSSSSGINDDSEYDAAAHTLTDLRDNQTYKTVTIGTQTWMAENLNYDPGDVSVIGSYAWHGCYENQSTNCAKYGRLYTWEVAMDNAACAFGKTCSPSGTIRGVCPSGWHLPSKEEWYTLFTAVGGKSNASTKLKTQTGWKSLSDVPVGTDTYGFSALPAGYRYGGGYFYSEGDYAYFWSSSESNSSYAYCVYLYYDYETAYLNDYDKDYGYSVRCVKND